MKTKHSQAELMQDAQIIGATHYRVYYTNTYLGAYCKEPEPFSYHFFDSSDEEVCYFICDMFSVYGMFKFDNPRKWSDSFKLNVNYSEPIDFRSESVCKYFTKKELSGALIK